MQHRNTPNLAISFNVFNMTFRKITLVFWSLFIVFTARSQTKQDSLDLWRDLNAYQRVNSRLDYDSILGFMPPKLFTVVPKNMMKQVLKSTFEDKEFKMELGGMVYDSVLPVVKIGNQICTMVGYDVEASITFTGEQDSSFLEIMIGVFTTQYGAENVSVDSQNTSKFNIKMPDKWMFALNEPEWDSWKFLEDKRSDGNEHQQKLMDLVIPREVLDYYK